MKLKQFCYLCGVNEANSDDHVPPKTLFPTDSPNKGYKLPACSKCNNLLHLDEEYLRDRFTIAGHNRTARLVFHQGTRRSYMRTYELLKTVNKLDLIRRDLTTLNIKSPGGIYLHQATGIKMDSARINRVIIKVTKGLYYYHFQKRIPDNFSFDIYFDPPNWLPEMMAKPTPLIGKFDDVFCYKGLVTNTDSTTGIWWLSFYTSLGLIVVVENPKLAKKVSLLRAKKLTK